MSKVIAFLNALYSSIDKNWKPTDDIPALIIEGFKEALPEILMLIAALKKSGGSGA